MYKVQYYQSLEGTTKLINLFAVTSGDVEEEEVVIKILVEGGVDNARYILTSCGPRLSVDLTCQTEESTWCGRYSILYDKARHSLVITMK